MEFTRDELAHTETGWKYHIIDPQQKQFWSYCGKYAEVDVVKDKVDENDPGMCKVCLKAYKARKEAV